MDEGSKKTKPIKANQSQNKANRRPLAGNPKDRMVK